MKRPIKSGSSNARTKDRGSSNAPAVTSSVPLNGPNAGQKVGRQPCPISHRPTGARSGKRAAKTKGHKVSKMRPGPKDSRVARNNFLRKAAPNPEAHKASKAGASEERPGHHGRRAADNNNVRPANRGRRSKNRRKGRKIKKHKISV